MKLRIIEHDQVVVEPYTGEAHQELMDLAKRRAYVTVKEDSRPAIYSHPSCPNCGTGSED